MNIFTDSLLKAMSLTNFMDIEYNFEATDEPKKEDYVKVPLRRGFTEIEHLFEVTTIGGMICGGYARYCASPNPNPALCEDVDIYAADMKKFEEIKKILGSANFFEEKETEYSVHFFKNTDVNFIACPKVNLIRPTNGYKMKTFGDVYNILTYFDFSVCRAAILSSKEALVHKHFEKDESEKKLRILKINDPVFMVRRIGRYLAKGYDIEHREVAKIFTHWEKEGQSFRTYIKNKAKGKGKPDYDYFVSKTTI